MKYDLEELAPNRRTAAAIAPFIRMITGLKDDRRVVSFQSFYNDADNGQSCSQIENAGLMYNRIPIADSVDELYHAIKDALTLADIPDVIVINGIGLFVLGYTKAETAAKIDCIKKGFLYIENAQVLCRPVGRLSGKIAVVTGSAQGFGEGIAEEMVAEGAYMVIADLNEALALEVADRLNRTYGAHTAISIRVNVTEERSVENLIEHTVSEFGGLDIYVSNAGVLKAGGLEEMTLESFEFVTKVNYTAYFLGVKYASRPMKIQALADPQTWSDIIQINSKSGLEGSNRNFAYAGGKFGGIGLTQSFALELVTEKIKVNSICPGNFYEGPLWSDPEKGLFVQYLKAGKVPGAQSIDDVRNFYLAKSPIRRGCSPADVAKAIFYCVEQQYETGQAVPVTGGQNMLN